MMILVGNDNWVWAKEKYLFPSDPDKALKININFFVNFTEDIKN